MRRLLVAAALLWPAAASALSEKDSVWLVTINHSGQNLHEFTLEYGTGKFYYQFFQDGLTFGDYARVKREQPLRCVYTDSSGARHELNNLRPLQPSMVGGIFRLTFEKDGAVSYDLERPSYGTPEPGVITSVPGMGFPGWHQWALLALLFLLGLAAVVGAAKLAARLKAKVKAVLRDPYAERLRVALSLRRKACPVPMYTLDPRHPLQWWEGRYRGRMVGLDGPRLWLGEPDEATRCVFRRHEPGGFRFQDYSGGESIPGVGTAPFDEALAGLSDSVAAVNVMSVALEATLDRAGDPEEVLARDLPRLDAMLAALVAGLQDQPKVEEPFVAALRKELGLARMTCPVEMYTLDPEHPVSWWQGRYGSRMVGFHHGRLWFGEPDEGVVCAFARDARGAMVPEAGFRPERTPGVESPAFREALERLSPAIAGVDVMPSALELKLAPGADPRALREDLPRLEAMLSAL